MVHLEQQTVMRTGILHLGIITTTIIIHTKAEGEEGCSTATCLPQAGGMEWTPTATGPTTCMEPAALPQRQHIHTLQ